LFCNNRYKDKTTQVKQSKDILYQDKTTQVKQSKDILYKDKTTQVKQSKTIYCFTCVVLFL
jgi:hypothetical protein